MAFSDNLQFLRNRQGQTQEQLAEILEVSRQSVSKWESAQSFPEMDTILRICDLYQVNLDTLLRGSVEDSLVEDTAQYDQFMNRFSRRMAFAVGSIIAGVGLCGLLDAKGVSEYLIFAVLLLIVAVCVVVIVASSLQKENFSKQYPVITDFYTEQEKRAFRQKFVWFISGGVGAILFDVALLLLFFAKFPEEEPFESYAMSVFLLIVAGAVTSFVYAGIQEEKYKIDEYNRDNNPTPEVKKRKGLINTICAALMTLVTALYVGLGLALDLWRTAWWVFAVGGILCAVVNIVLDPYRDEN
ncbi:helix-turn-helix domain-containing protein [Flintibacter muris]|uniref:helix-turn-helix domain-containing protein n=1 Tax=Flintibacter muris TaxID=2941327 RepID=UPI00203F75CF|nr:helix-turn-helix transcriptional regulator [Flintibacter muris]